MLIIYFKSDGEIFQVATGYKTFEEFYNARAEEFSKVFEAIYIEEVNDFILNRPFEFRVIDGKLKMRDESVLLKILS